MPTKTKLSVALIITMFVLGAVATTAVAQSSPREDWDQAEGTGEIILDADSYYRVFQGEEDIQGWKNPNGTDISDSILTGVPNGGAEGEQLELVSSVPRSQETGRYADTDVTALVAKPRIVSVDMYNHLGVEIGSGSSLRQNQKLLVRATWNFADAEDVELELTDDRGVNVVREALSDSPSEDQEEILPSGFNNGYLERESQGIGTTGHRTAYWLIDLDQLDDGSHSLTVKGVDDLDFGDATESVNIDVGAETRPALSLERSTVTQGERLRFTVVGSDPGRYHAVGIPIQDLRNQNANPDDVFRLAGDTIETGSTEGFAYGVVEIDDDGVGIGIIDTGLLDDTRVTATLFEGRNTRSRARQALEDGLDADDRGLRVEEGRIVTNIGGFSYAIGDSTTLRGTASSGVDGIAIYVRDRGDWTLLQLNGRNTTGVRADGTWVARDVVLSDEKYAGREILRYPGTYQIAAVNADSLPDPIPVRIPPSEISEYSPSRNRLRSVGPYFSARMTADEVAQGDRLHVSGVSVGSDEVVVSVIGERGRVVSEVIDVGDNNLFEENIDLGDIRRGDATVLATTPGRDGEFGDGSATSARGQPVSTRSASSFSSFVEGFDRRGLAKDQIVERILSESADERGTDDLLQRDEIRVASPSTEIDDVVPDSFANLTGVRTLELGETAVVRGTTNRNPDDTSITLEATEGASADELPLVTVETWNRETGEWSASVDTEGLETDEYVLRAEDGDGESSDTVTVRVVAEGERRAEEMRSRDDLTSEIEDLESRIENVTTENRELETRIENLTSRNENLSRSIDDLESERQSLEERLRELNESREEGEDQPGFGFVTVLVAVAVVAAVSVVRRRRRQ
ncbi:hypothetical protein ACEU6E_02400 [Halorutilales archaeon Cl-col2-1]